MFQHKNTINCCGASISPAIVFAALMKSGLHWEMHMAQQYAMESLALDTPVVLETEVTDETAREIMSHVQTNATLMGIPVVVDNERYPKSLVRLMAGDIELSRIELLAVPGAFMGQSDYTEEGLQRERDKFAKLTYGD